jgi:hypothetical protein
MEVLKCRTGLLYNLMQRVYIKGFEMHFQPSYFKYTKVKRRIAIYDKKICSSF